MNKENEMELSGEIIELSDEALGIQVQTKGLSVTTLQMYQAAAEILKQVKSRAKELEAKRKSLTAPLDESKKRIMDFFRVPLQALTDAEAAIKRAMLTYDQEQDRKRREEEARLQELARKEQERLEKLAEKKAEKAEAKGNMERAEEIRQSVPCIPVPVVPSARQKVDGISTRTTWGGEVTDKMALIKAVAGGYAPATLLDVNMPVLNQMARALKGEMAYPGVRAVATQQIAA